MYMYIKLKKGYKNLKEAQDSFTDIMEVSHRKE